jgi:phage terminase small subunit
MGRSPKSTTDLKLLGAFRADRHGDRADAVPPDGVPVRPKELTDDEGELWEQVIAFHRQKNTLGEIDTAGLIALCEAWGLYRQTVDLAKQYPTDKETRCAVVAYEAMFERLAVQFGIGPIARAKLKLPKSDGKKPVPARNRA